MGVEKSGAKTGQDADSTPDKRGMRVEYTADQRTADDCRKHTGDLDGVIFFMKKDGASRAARRSGRAIAVLKPGLR